jgi:hypothetical protein
VLDLAAATVAPELAYVTARYAALVPFGKAATRLSELLPISGAVNADTVRNRTPVPAKMGEGKEHRQPSASRPRPWRPNWPV